MLPTRLAVLLVAVFALLLVVYREAFVVRPSADDFIIPLQIRRAEQTSPLQFFRYSPVGDYRPLQWVLAWAAGRTELDDPFRALHRLNFVAFAWYALILALWIRRLCFSSLAAASTLAFVFLHPVLAGPLTDTDGFTRFVVSGWVWLGVYFADRFADRLGLALPLVGSCFLVGLGFMEYAVGLVGLATLAVLSRRGERPLFGAGIVLSVLVVLFLIYYTLRVSVIGFSDAGRLSLSPVDWLRNFTLLGTAIFYMGSTAEVAISPTALRLLTLACSILLVATVVGVGLWLWRGHARGTRIPPSIDLPYLGALFLASFAPMVFMQHVSEIYATPIVFALGLLVGRAADGWWLRGRPFRTDFVAVFAIIILWGAASASSKVEAMRQLGERAERQIGSLLAQIPADARDMTVALVFQARDLPLRRRYSVFHSGDDYLIQPGTGHFAAEWFLPGRDIRWVHVIRNGDSSPVAGDAGLVLCWNAAYARFETTRGGLCQ